MTSGLGSSSQGAPGVYCGMCGRPLSEGLVACPNCGTPVVTPAAGGWTAPPAAMQPSVPPVAGGEATAAPPMAYQRQYLTPGMTPPAPPTPPVGTSATQWAGTPATGPMSVPTWQTPGAMGGAPGSPPRRSKRAVIIGTISVVVVLALLGTGVAYMLGAFSAHTELDAARYLPGNTVVFSGFDTINFATNGHNIRLQDLLSGSGSGSGQKVGGLDLQNDILPWLGRDVAVGVFSVPGSGSASGLNPFGNYGTVILAQSHDDAKAQAAMRKAANDLPSDEFGGSSGTVITQTYNGFTLYIQPKSSYDFTSGNTTSDPNGQTFTAGKGWAVIASMPAAAKAVIDRINGTGDTLAAQNAFVDATSDLPSNRFGTLYINVKQLTDALASVPGMQSSLQAVQAYPAGVGYTAWTDTGLHAQVTFKATHSTGVQYPSGDALALAKLVPATSYGYVSINNLGGDLQAGLKANPQSAQYGQLISQLLGDDLSDPALQQPAALAVYPSSGTSPLGGALLLKAPDAAAAAAMLQKVADAHQCTVDQTTVAGQQAETLTCPPLDLNALTGTRSNSTSLTGDSTDMTSSGTTLYAAQVGGALVMTTEPDLLQPIVAAAGGSSTLAQSGDFQSLVKAAPSNAQYVAYLNLHSLMAMVPAQAASNNNPAMRASGLLISGAATDTQSQLDVDVSLNG